MKTANIFFIAVSVVFLCHCCQSILELNDILSKHSLCLVTGNSNFTVNNYHLYPVEIYDKSSMRNNTVACYHKDSVNRHGAKQAFFNCPLIPTACPVTSENIFQFVNKTRQWLTGSTMSSLCRAKHYLADKKEIVRVVTFGSSVTAGAFTQGCCTGPNCPYTQDDKSDQSFDMKCAWPHYLGRWMDSIFNATVETVNVAGHGATSQTVSDDFEDIMKRNQVQPFSDHDLIFLDLSVTDATLSSSEQRVGEMERALTSLVDKIFAHKADGSRSRPTVILLEMETLDRQGVHSAQYLRAYERVARAHRIPIWSYRDAVLNGFSQLQADSPETSQYVAYLRLNSLERANHHPPWHVHLFYADLLAAVLLREFAVCDRSALDRGITSSLNDDNHSDIANVSRSVDRCDKNAEPLLDISYDKVVNKLPIVGHFHTPNNSWRVGTDERGRGGFIRNLNDKSICQKDNNAALTFTLNITSQHLWHDPLSRYLLRVRYLRSYTNAGVVDVLVCGHVISTLDALWSDFAVNKYSLPQIAHVEFNHTICIDKEDSKQENKEKTLSVQSIEIEFIHRVQGCTKSNQNEEHFAPSLVQIVPRLNQMVRIESLSVCTCRLLTNF